MDYQQEEEKAAKRKLELTVVPLRDCRYILLPDVNRVYSIGFDHEPVILILRAA